ncbi:hypothetical protein CA983_22955 [Streptomyces swartbergensis]|uniref:DNA-binding response regulator n=1 Tax=Streptomyces swartbergensis TaxID=487165 RepID=A0A243S0A8_9ACTN|nr:hypothetical protein CA983_22955 [Streptomyces swartbergensis]
MKVLLVEDDAEVASALTEGLEDHGWTVDHVSTGRAALRVQDPGEVILLDLNLPDMDGLEVCRGLRDVRRAPIIAVTARSDEMDKVLCLRLGADDYVVKPYRLQELLARMVAVVRRAHGTQEERADTVVTQGAFSIDRDRREVRVMGRHVHLTRKEFDLLVLLSSAPGRVFSREFLLAEVWRQEWMGSGRTLDTHVASLRRKLGSTEWIRTSRGVGFSFHPPSDLTPEISDA